MAFLQAGSLAAAEPAREVVAYAGRYDPLNEETPEIGWEVRLPSRRYRWQPHWLPDLSPLGGVMTNGGGAIYAYGGLATGFELAPRWWLTPSVAAGFYARQSTVGLGGPVQFRSAIELSYALANQSRLGLSFYHLSNSRLYSSNPGSESLVVAYVARFGRLPRPGRAGDRW